MLTGESNHSTWERLDLRWMRAEMKRKETREVEVALAMGLEVKSCSH
jgi:hypothetical protein